MNGNLTTGYMPAHPQPEALVGGLVIGETPTSNGPDLARRQAIAATPGLIGGMRMASAAETVIREVEPAVLPSGAFGAMVGMLTDCGQDRLKHVARTSATDKLRKLPCRLVTSDDDLSGFKRRMGQAYREINRVTGVDVAPVGQVQVTVLGQSVHARLNEIEAIRDQRVRNLQQIGRVTLRNERQQASFVRVKSTEVDVEGHVRSVNLPNGGIAATSVIDAVEDLGEAVVLHLGRRVNARSLMITREAALAAARQVKALKRAPTREESRCVRDEAGQLMVVLSKGGLTGLSRIAKVEYAGPVIMVTLDRRVNARSITVARADAVSLLSQLKELAEQIGIAA